MHPKYIVDYKIKVKDDFFDKFTAMTETRYFVWKGTETKCGGIAGEIVSYIWKVIDEYPKRKSK